MEIDDLTLHTIAHHMSPTVNREIVEAVAYAARIGWADTTCHAFVAALVMTDNLTTPSEWPYVLRKISDLKIAADLAALEAGKTITRPIE